MRRASVVLVALAALPLAAAAYMYSVALRDPVVRRASIAMPDWPAGARPMRVVLIADIHVAGPDMPPTRLARIVNQVNALAADIILLAGDFVSDKRVASKSYAAAEGLAPLAKLKAPGGIWSVLGNHDHWRDAVEISRALRAANVRILDNEAVSVGGLRLGGVGDSYTNNADLRATVKAMRSGPGSRVLLSHSPDIAAKLPQDITLVLSGHTHCGQIRLPVIGAFSYASNYGERYACGVIVEGSRRVVVSAGLGTSVLPFRLGAAPDIWLLTIGPGKAPGS